ncbi:gamma-glutamylcyclotransferase [Paracoccus laeviglucosivorans]|uniref:glutathione-specific gamma-glutamylcyclotransferase n=1 Tax=Paracoccus laeviglucosivorans TaxID=1197861 RepID=A0A521BXI6_9RHOB|nr:gamma-glutamylcyclotransferase [Paracoccus laeviglucosivorans]SMO51912.1 cation transport protein ChaC [Paracoccus laeviglucosivorans]
MTEVPQYWVFAYGSLMWDPGFVVAERVLARLDGYARRFCLLSVVYRGTVEVPGLVLALDHEADAHCMGLALRVDAADWPEVLAGLRARELTTNAYQERMVVLDLPDGRRVEAVAYVTKRDHDQYAGGLDLDAQARMIARATGGRGPNADYLFNTASHLVEIGVDDVDIAALALQVRKLIAPPQGDG